jgi:predicted Zn-dependent protease
MRLPKPEFPVLLFGPEMPATGLRGRAHFENGVLVLHAQGHWYTAPSTDIRLKMGGFDGRQWLLEWQSPVGVFTAILRGDEAVRQFIAEAPAPVAQRLHAARKAYTKRGFRFRLAVAVMVALVCLLLCALVWFWLNGDVFSKWAADRVSLEQEVRLGEMALAQMRGGMQFLPEDAPAEEVVDRIGVRLTVGSPYPFHFYVVRDARVNAFALPGGKVVVFTGLLQAADSAEEVAGVLAHEVSHVERRHALRNLIHGLGLRAVMAVALGDYAGGVWGGMAGQLAELSYGRDLEREADLDGLAALRKAGLPAQGMVAFFEKMAAREAGDIDLLSSHPASKERLQALRAAMAKQGPYMQRPLDVDWNAIRKSLQANH